MAALPTCKPLMEDAISHCGSIAGDSILWHRKESTCSLRHHSLSVQGKPNCEQGANVLCSSSGNRDEFKNGRFNTSFHHFRFAVVMMGGMSIGLMILMRLNVTVAILNMVNQTALYMEEHPNKTIDDFLDEGYSLGGDFDWNNEIQQMIMSWYMLAYTLPQLPATSLGMKIGGRFSAPISLVICSIATLLTPMAAYQGWQWVICLRLINGIGAASLLPMMIYLIEHWMPYEEFSLGLTCATTIQVCMLALNPLICGYLCAIHWSYAFYVPGAIVLAFCVLWIILITDRPDASSLVSQKELDIICGCPKIKIEGKQQQAGAGAGAGDSDCRKAASCGDAENGVAKASADDNQETWFDVLKSPVFYAYVFIWIFLCSTVTAFLFVMPTYLRQFLKIGVADNGTYCFIILSASLLSVLWPHPVLRIMETKLGLSLTASRRILYYIVCIMVGGTWIYAGHFHTDQLIAFFLNRCFHCGNDVIIIGTIMSNFSKTGLSSIVLSMINTVGNLSVVFVSPLVGYVLDYTAQSEAGWTYIFYALGLTQALMMFTYGTLIRSEPVQLRRSAKKSTQIVAPANGKDNDIDKSAPTNRNKENNNNKYKC